MSAKQCSFHSPYAIVPPIYLTRIRDYQVRTYHQVQKLRLNMSILVKQALKLCDKIEKAAEDALKKHLQVVIYGIWTFDINSKALLKSMVRLRRS
jgi:glycosyltransferase A (GT-A) superfamily protein (DUF2064 family)